jgi:hypothetical protein
MNFFFYIGFFSAKFDVKIKLEFSRNFKIMFFNIFFRLNSINSKKMTFFHFVNCVGLASAPYFLTYKYAGL